MAPNHGNAHWNMQFQYTFQSNLSALHVGNHWNSHLKRGYKQKEKDCYQVQVTKNHSNGTPGKARTPLGKQKAIPSDGLWISICTKSEYAVMQPNIN